MLKRFFISMLGTMAGLWLSLFFLVIIGCVSVGILATKAIFSSSAPSYKNAILHITLQGEIPERAEEVSPTDLLLNGVSDATSLADMIAAVRMAADDKEIKGIFLECQGSSLGIASRQELIEALNTFKATGKWIYAYANNYTQGDYYVATVADRLYVNPVGMIDVHGLAGTVTFYKDLLDKIGVQVQVVKVGAYKSAVEPYISTKMSEPAREQTTIFLNQIWENMTDQMADNLGISPIYLNQYADSITFTWNPQRYVDCNLAYSLQYANEVENKMREKLGLAKDDDLPSVTPAEYLDINSSKIWNGTGDHIAVLYAVGSITDDGTSGIVASDLVPEILRLAKDENVAGMVLRVNSPGGSAFASEQIWKALEDFKTTGKKLYVSMGDYAASGGYYISCGADKIYADPATLTGSIGIFGLIPNAKGLLTDKLGLHFETIATNKDSNFPAIVEPMTETQYAAMQSFVERGYDLFTSRVAEGRSIPQDSVKAIGGGRVWDAMTAIKIGLVDKIGSLHQAVKDLTKECGLDEDEFICYPKMEDKWLAMLKKLGIKLDTNIDMEAISPEELKQVLRMAREIETWDPLQARMEQMVIE